MNIVSRVVIISGLIIALCSGCVLFRPEPTPIAWLPTPTPTEPASSQIDQPTNTPAPSPVTLTPEALTPTVTPTETPTPIEQIISVIAPLPDATVSNPLHIAGNVAMVPLEGTLIVRIYDVNGAIAAEMPIIAQGEMGQPGTFDAQVVYGGIPGPGRLEILDISVKDGSTIAKTEVPLQLGGFPGAGVIQLPQTQERVSLPIRLLARVGNPGQNINITLVWEDGMQFTQAAELIPGSDGRGLLITKLDMPDHLSSHPPTQSAQISITSVEGSPLALQPITVLAPRTGDTMTTQVYWVIDENVTAETITVPRTAGIARTSLNHLIWGPSPQNPLGYTSALPTPLEIFSHPAHASTWGEYVRINSLTILNGVANVDFSAELLAHSGGTTQIELIRQQIEMTLLQFSTVDSVIITVEGVEDSLQP